MGKVQEVTRELVSQWESKFPELKQLNDMTLDKPRGYAIDVATIARICGSRKTLMKVLRFWRESVKWLRGITVEYHYPTRAYRFIEVDRHLGDRHQKRMRSIERQHRAEWQRLAVIRDDDMTDHQRRLRAFAMQQHQDSAGKVEASREHYRIATTCPETLPRIAAQ